ncbi:MAG: branched-chain amino acid ABC transporter permease [Holophaga sp.]|nr:branched-chain amino acid ABC transporter permease [Holophaga sp.]
MWFYIQGILCLAMINIIAVLGVTVFTGFTGLFSLGHAAFIASGAYTAAILTHFYGVDFYLALAAGALVSGLLSLVIGVPTLRAKLRSDYFAIATLGFGEAFKMILENMSITQGARGLPGITTYANFTNILVLLIITVFVTIHFVFSKYGRMAVAAREDATAAEMMGINLFRVQLRSLFFSATLAGLAGGLFAHYLGFIQPSLFTGAQSSMLVIAVVTGGMGSITGPILAALLFATIPEALRMANMWRMVTYGAVLVAIMVLRPQGILGYREFTIRGTINLFRRLFGKGGNLDQPKGTVA